MDGRQYVGSCPRLGAFGMRTGMRGSCIFEKGIRTPFDCTTVICVGAKQCLPVGSYTLFTGGLVRTLR